MKNQYSREVRAMVERAREQGFYLGLQTATDAHALAINDLYHIGPGQPRRHAQAFSRFRGAVCKFPPQFFGCGSYGTGSGDSRDQRTASNLHGDPRYDPHLLPES